jgi:hypothetical protein
MKRGEPTEPCVGGIFREIVDSLIERGEASPPDAEYGRLGRFRGSNIFDIESLKRFLDGFAANAGVELRFFTQFLDADVEAGRIRGVFVAGKSGVSYAPCQVVVDCSGDADVAFRSGFETIKGRAATGLMTAGTLVSMIENVDIKAIEKHIADGGDYRFRPLVKELKEKGLWPYPEETIIIIPTFMENVVWNNTSRIVGLDGTNEQSLTEAMIYGRRNAYEFLEKVLRPYYPGFKKARLRWTAPYVGIRETRKIVGEYTLTEDDVERGVSFPDTIAMGSWGWDLPDPTKPSLQIYSKQFGGRERALSPTATAIPYRSLVPKESENLIVAGRCLSVEDMALGVVRTMPPCMAMGEAAGVAASMCAKGGFRPQEVDPVVLRRILLENGAVLS